MDIAIAQDEHVARDRTVFAPHDDLRLNVGSVREVAALRLGGARPCPRIPEGTSPLEAGPHNRTGRRQLSLPHRAPEEDVFRTSVEVASAGSKVRAASELPSSAVRVAVEDEPVTPESVAALAS